MSFHCDFGKPVAVRMMTIWSRNISIFRCQRTISKIGSERFQLCKATSVVRLEDGGRGRLKNKIPGICARSSQKFRQSASRAAFLFHMLKGNRLNIHNLIEHAFEIGTERPQIRRYKTDICVRKCNRISVSGLATKIPTSFKTDWQPILWMLNSELNINTPTRT